MTKALLIRSYEVKTTGIQGSWNKLDQTSSYIQGIETGKILENMTADNLSQLISGVPTPWARAKLFRFAFHTIANPDPNINSEGLLQFYKLLLGEWRGLLAVMALFPDRISISNPVTMNVNGGNYDIASAFGRMLFDEADLWCDQEALMKNPATQPFIQLIYYKGHLVGGTSPLTGIFTGVSYNLERDAQNILWYRNGKFEDPTVYLSPAQLQKVYLFIKSINSHLVDYEEKINSARTGKPIVNIDGFKQMSRNWEEELFEKGEQRLRPIGPVANYGKYLSCPFNILFNSATPIYLKPDYTFTYTDDPMNPYQKIDDIQSLLSDDKFVVGWRELSNAKPSLKDAPVFFLSQKEINGTGTSYFTLPLSEQAIEIFRNGLASILGYKPKQGVSVTADIIHNGESLAVNMVVLIDGEEVALGVREYKILWQTKIQKVILWPNFISNKWTRYYLYEQKSEASQPTYLPIFQSERNIIKTPDGSFFTALYAPNDGSKLPVDIKELVASPADAGDTLPKYRISLANKPVAGLLAMVKQGGKDACAGFLIVRQDDKVKNLSGLPLQPSATVGFDFGSNNTCIYYNVGSGECPHPVEFHNYRAMLVGSEIPNPNRVAEIDELLFFTNYDADDGQFKSWVHEHDSRCNPYTQMDEIAGGVPVNRPNVNVEEMTERHIKTQAGILHYNMKWLNDSEGLKMKRAFIKSLWLQACAFLYQKQIRPSRISWSYPGAMIPSDITELDNTFGALPAITPITNILPKVNDPVTESEAVCSYAISQPDFGLTYDNVYLGIDVGGSTSDILLLAKDSNKGGAISLLRESSVRLAAGVFFNAVTNSARFREALVTFHGGKNTGVYVMNIEELMDAVNKDKAPYYLNCIFDQLKPNEYDKFYEFLAYNAKFVFTIPAYVTGVLLFYSGMLIGKAVKDGRLSARVGQIEVLPFGKGGRLFHWLNSAAGRATETYYSECVNRGVACVADREFVVNLRKELAKNNKTEVAFGLCSPQAMNVDNAVGESDICGERGVTYINDNGIAEELGVDEELGGTYFKNLDRFDFSNGQCFHEFMNIFSRFVCKTTTIYEDDELSLQRDIYDVPGRITNFIKNDTEYDKAENTANSQTTFPYHQPIFIAEAASYLRTLVDKIFAY